MARKGRQLEKLVAQLEQLFGPTGVTVKSPDYVVGRKSGSQREVDVSLRGSLGSSEVFIMIECRDRSDTEFVDWIDQLKGKRDDVGADKVVAVSSTGFSSGARGAAEGSSIELRTMEELDVTDFLEWYGHKTLFLMEPKADNVRLHLWDVASLEERQPTHDELFAVEGGKDGAVNLEQDQLIRAVGTGEYLTMQQLWAVIWKNVDLPANHPRYEERSPIEGRDDGWQATPSVERRLVIHPENTIEVEHGSEAKKVGLIAVTFEWWQEQVEVPITTAHDYSGGDGVLGRIAVARFESDTVAGAFYLQSSGPEPDPKMTLEIRAKTDGA